MITQPIHQEVSTDSAVVAIFSNHEFASSAVKELAAAHFDITKISVVGRGYHTEEDVSGFYNAGNRIMFWGKYGAFWGGLWGLLMGGIFMTVPIIGPLIVVGWLATVVVSATEGVVIVGGLSALAAALYSVGIPKDSVLKYEQAIKSDEFLVMVHGTGAEVANAREILRNGRARQIQVHDGVTTHAATNDRSTLITPN